MEKKLRVKGFDQDLKCRGYQFEIGKEFKIELNGRKMELCSDTVFHYCDSLSKVHNYYSCDNTNNRFCLIEVLGEEVSDEEKCGSNHIKIVRELTGEELAIAKGLTGGNSGLFNSGDMNSGYRNSGDMNSGDRNSGDMNSGYRNSGDRNSGDMNSGDMNSGDMNSGDRNSGDMNSGDRNSGDRNSGDMNSGDRNSGDRNSGDRNSGIFNKTNGSNGVFCNIEPKICIFNIQTDWTLSEFMKSKYYYAIISAPFELTEWVLYSDEETSMDEEKARKGGYLKVNTYEDACKKWWENLDTEAKEIIQQIPNFNWEVFTDITGIKKGKF